MSLHIYFWGFFKFWGVFLRFFWLRQCLSCPARLFENFPTPLPSTIIICCCETRPFQQNVTNLRDEPPESSALKVILPTISIQILYGKSSIVKLLSPPGFPVCSPLLDAIGNCSYPSETSGLQGKSPPGAVQNQTLQDLT